MKVYQRWFLARTQILGLLSKGDHGIFLYKYVPNETQLDSKSFPVFNSQIPDHIVFMPGLRFAVTYSREIIQFYNNKINRDYRIVTTLFQVPRFDIPMELRPLVLDENNNFINSDRLLQFVKDKKIEVSPLLESVRRIGQDTPTETCLSSLKSI